MERREGGVWSRAGRAGAGGDPRACVQAMPRRWSRSWLVLPASRWWSRLRECPWARGAASPARGGDGVCPLSALPQLRGRWGGTRSRRRRPGSLDSGAWSDGILGGRGAPLPPGGPLARCPPQHRLSLRSERQRRHRPRRGGTGVAPGICESPPATCKVSLGTLGGSAGWVTLRMEGRGFGLNPSRRTCCAVNQETFTLSSFSWFLVGFVGFFFFLEG